MDSKLIAEGKGEEYSFSSNLEVKAVERKLRTFGQILAKKGVDVESIFQQYDPSRNGCVSRTDFLKVLSELGIYLLEEGKILKENNSQYNNQVGKDLQLMQRKQIYQLKGDEGTFISNAPRLARKLFDQGRSGRSGGMIGGRGNTSEFKNHIESLTLIDWYRKGQKQMLLQHVLSHSLAHTIHLYPR
jgi:hypothetical protein